MMKRREKASVSNRDYYSDVEGDSDSFGDSPKPQTRSPRIRTRSPGSASSNIIGDFSIHKHKSRALRSEGNRRSSGRSAKKLTIVIPGHRVETPQRMYERSDTKKQSSTFPEPAPTYLNQAALNSLPSTQMDFIGSSGSGRSSDSIVSRASSVYSVYEQPPAREFDGMYVATRARAKSLLKHRGESFRDSNAKDYDTLKRYLQSLREFWSAMCVGCMVAGFLFWVAEMEIEHRFLTRRHGVCASYSLADSNLLLALYILQSLISLSSLLLVFSLFKFHFVKFNLLKAKKQRGPDASFFRSEIGRHCLAESVLCFLHVPPYLSYCFETEVVFNSDFKAVYRVQVLNIFMIVRFLVFIRYISYHNRFNTAQANMVLSLYQHRPSFLLALKDVLAGHGARFLFFLGFYFGAMVTLGYGVCIFERNAGHEILGSEFSPSYANSVWLVWSVITSIGSGEVVALSPFSRLILVIGGLLGSTVGAVIVSVTWASLEFTVHEKKVVWTMDWLELKSKVPVLASNVIRTWWLAIRQKKNSRKPKPIWDNSAFIRALSRWKNARSTFEKYRHSPTDPSDLAAHVKEVAYLVEEVRVANNNTRIEILQKYNHQQQTLHQLEMMMASLQSKMSRRNFDAPTTANPGTNSINLTSPRSNSDTPCDCASANTKTHELLLKILRTMGEEGWRGPSHAHTRIHRPSPTSPSLPSAWPPVYNPNLETREKPPFKVPAPAPSQRRFHDIDSEREFPIANPSPPSTRRTFEIIENVKKFIRDSTPDISTTPRHQHRRSHRRRDTECTPDGRSTRKERRREGAGREEKGSVGISDDMFDHTMWGSGPTERANPPQFIQL